MTLQDIAPSPRALHYANFRHYVVARFLMTFAVQMQSVAVGWQVYAHTGDTLDLGLIGLSQFLPFVILVLPAGHVADRMDRRLILTGCFALEALCAVLLLLYTLSGSTAVWPVFSVLVVFGAARAFSMPTGQAITPNLVPGVAFPNAVALNSSTFHVATIAGPAAGGMLYVLGPTTVYSSVAVVLVIAMAMMLRVRLPRTLRAPEPATRQSLLQGLHFVWTRKVVLGAISLDLFAVLFGGATAMLPAYASDVLHVGPQGLGWLRAAPAIGATLCAALLAFRPISRSVGRWMFSGVAVFGLSIIAFGLSDNFYLSLGCLMILGGSDMVSVYIRHLLVQMETPDAIRGRVSAVNAVFIGASNELGEFESGVTATWFGLIPSVVLGGAATLVVTVLWTRLFPALAHMDRLPARRED